MSAFLEEARVERKDFCLSVGASEPVVHWEGLLSWEDMGFVWGGFWEKEGGLVVVMVRRRKG